MSITEIILHFATNLISSSGYVGVGLLMAGESMILPIPSEAVMPFAGFLIFQSKFSFVLVIVISTLGSIVGSLISYWIGRYAGRAFIDRWGKYFLLNHHHLDATDRFFARNGEKTVFISRFIPVVRHLISIPAGIGEMNIKKFLLYTTIGAALWNTFLAYLGFRLGESWNIIQQYGHRIDIGIAALLVCIIAILLLRYKPWMKKKTLS